MDAAVAATLVTMVTEPGIVSLAGGAYATVWPAGEPDAVTVDGYVAMPGLGRPIDAPDPVAREVRTDYGAGVTMTAGHASVAVPGALAGLSLLHSALRCAALAGGGRAGGGGRPDRVPAGCRVGLLPPVRPGDALRVGPARPRPRCRGTTARGWRRATGWSSPGWRRRSDADRGRGRRDDVRRTARRGRRLGHGRQGRAGHPRRPRGLPAGAAAALPSQAGSWALRTNPPPAIGGACWSRCSPCSGDRPDGAWTEDDVAHLVSVQRRVLDARRDRLDVADDREAAALDLLREVGWAGAGSPEHGARVGGGRRRDRLRGDRVLRLRVGGDGPGHRPVAEQLPRRARAQPGVTTGARCPAGEQHGADGGPGSRRLGARDREPRCRPHHDGPAPGARAVRPRRRPVCRRRWTGRGCTSTTWTQAIPTARRGSRPRRTCPSRRWTCRCAGTIRTRCTSVGCRQPWSPGTGGWRRRVTRVGPV